MRIDALWLVLAAAVACGRSAVSLPARLDAGVTTPVSPTATGGVGDPVWTTSGPIASGGQPEPSRTTGTGGTTATGGSGGAGTAPPAASAVACGDGFTCALKSDGTVRCWGDNPYGQLGTGSSSSSPTPDSVWGIENAVGVATGSQHACAVLSDGTVKCWGGADRGQIGDGITTYTFSPAPVENLAKVTALSAGQYHTCAVQAGGTVACWGLNSGSQLGHATTSSCTIPNNTTGPTAPRTIDVPCGLTPVAVTGLANARAVGAGSGHSCALLADGTVSCWGNNSSGQLGDGTTSSRTSPGAVSGLDGAIALAVGEVHACALLADGTVRCWGGNAYGQLGNGMLGPTESSALPVAVSGLTQATAISAGATSSCAVSTDGSIRCWGGTAALGPGVATPVAVANLTSALAVSVGASHACAVLRTGGLRCWGVNAQGQLGDGGTANSLVPVDVGGL
jgi:alpha-tubulin suppressor-like RCC1 family protein